MFFIISLYYNFNKVYQGNADILYSQNMPINYMGDGKPSFDDANDTFISITSGNSRIKKPVFHVSLNPHPEDKISDENLIEIAKYYMKNMGYGDQPFIVFKHRDIDRYHIHIVASRINKKGNKINDSNERFRSKRITDEIEIKFNLKNKKQGFQNTDDIEKIRPNETNITNKISNILRATISQWDFQSLGEMNTILKKYNIQAEKTEKFVKGKKYYGIAYYIIDDDANRTSNPKINSSAIGKGVGLSALNKKFEKSKKDSLLKLAILKKNINKYIYNSKNLDDFSNKLKNNDIEVVFRWTKDRSKIYGVTFIHDKLKIAANGSKIDRSLSAKTFNDLFIEKDSKIDNKNTNIINNKIDDISNSNIYNISEELEDLFSLNEPLNIYTSNDSIIDEIEEAKFRNSIKKKDAKKRRKRNNL